MLKNSYKNFVLLLPESEEEGAIRVTGKTPPEVLKIMAEITRRKIFLLPDAVRREVYFKIHEEPHKVEKIKA